MRPSIGSCSVSCCKGHTEVASTPSSCSLSYGQHIVSQTYWMGVWTVLRSFLAFVGAGLSEHRKVFCTRSISDAYPCSVQKKFRYLCDVLPSVRCFPQCLLCAWVLYQARYDTICDYCSAESGSPCVQKQWFCVQYLM